MRYDRAVLGGAGALLTILPLALLGGALGFQYLGGLAPCEMCMWQRWALVGALVFATAGWMGFRSGTARPLFMLAALAVLAGAGIAAFHVGVEQHWWKGITRCAAAATSGSTADIISQVLAQPMIRCDAIAWSLFGISMAGYNAIISGFGGGYALWRLIRR